MGGNNVLFRITENTKLIINNAKKFRTSEEYKFKIYPHHLAFKNQINHLLIYHNISDQLWFSKKTQTSAYLNFLKKKTNLNKKQLELHNSLRKKAKGVRTDKTKIKKFLNKSGKSNRSVFNFFGYLLNTQLKSEKRLHKKNIKTYRIKLTASHQYFLNYWHTDNIPIYVTMFFFKKSLDLNFKVLAYLQNKFKKRNYIQKKLKSRSSFKIKRPKFKLLKILKKKRKKLPNAVNFNLKNINLVKPHIGNWRFNLRVYFKEYKFIYFSSINYGGLNIFVKKNFFLLHVKNTRGFKKISYNYKSQLKKNIKSLILFTDINRTGLYKEYFNVVKASDRFFFSLGSTFLGYGLVNKILSGRKLPNTNYYPIALIDNIALKKISKKLHDNVVPDYHAYISRYVINFLEFFTKKKILLNFSMKWELSSVANYFIIISFRKYKYYQFRIGRGFFLEEMFRVICHALRLRDSFFLLNWAVKTMLRINFYKQKVFLRLFRKFFITHQEFLLTHFKCKGFFFDIRGKVGVKGNSKRRHFAFSIGENSFSKKNLAMDMDKRQLWGRDGCCGLTLIIFF